MLSPIIKCVLSHSIKIRPAYSSSNEISHFQWHFRRAVQSKSTIIDKFKSLSHHKNGIDDALSIYKSLNPQHRTGGVLNEILRLCLIHKSPHKMLEISDDILSSIESRCIATNSLLRLCRKLLLSEQKDSDQRQRTTRLMIDRVLMEWESASSSSSRAMEMDTESKLILISILGEIGDQKYCDSVMTLFESICHFEPNAVAVGVTMKCLMKYGRYRQSAKLFEHHLIGGDWKWSEDTEWIISLYLKSVRYSMKNDVIDLNQLDAVWRLLTESKTVKLEHIEMHSVSTRNALISFEGERGDIVLAMDLLHEIPDSMKDIVSINATMKCLMDNGQSDGAIALFSDYVQNIDSKSDLMAIPTSLKADDRSLTLLFAAILRTENFDEIKGSKSLLSMMVDIERTVKYRSMELLNCLIAIKAKYGDIDGAERIFKVIKDSTKKIDGVTLSVMMRCYIEQRVPRYHKAIALYESMTKSGRMRVNESSIVLMLKCCTKTGDLERGQRVIAEQQQNGNHEKWSRLSIQYIDSLITFHGEFGDIETAEKYFKSISNRNGNANSVNAMMSGYVDNERYTAAIGLYEEYSKWMELDDRSHGLFLKALAAKSHFHRGLQLIKRLKLNRKLSVELKNAMISFLGRCGRIEEAMAIFDEMKMKDPELRSDTVNAMMTALSVHQRSDCVLRLFREHCPWIKSDGDGDGHFDEGNEWCFAVSIALDVCGQIMAKEEGQRIIDDLKWSSKSTECPLRRRLDDEGALSIDAAVISFYAKCGEFECAEAIFDGISISLDLDRIRGSNGVRAVFGAMISCFAKKGAINKMMEIFHEMKRHRISIGNNVFAVILSALSHHGMVDEVMDIWNGILNEKAMEDIDPSIVNAVIDGLGRNCRFEEGLCLFQSFCEYSPGVDGKIKMDMVSSLLSSSKTHGDSQMIRRLVSVAQNILYSVECVAEEQQVDLHEMKRIIDFHSV